MRISDWSSDVCSSDLVIPPRTPTFALSGDGCKARLSMLSLLAVHAERCLYIPNEITDRPYHPLSNDRLRCRARGRGRDRTKWSTQGRATAFGPRPGCCREPV